MPSVQQARAEFSPSLRVSFNTFKNKTQIRREAVTYTWYDRGIKRRGSKHPSSRDPKNNYGLIPFPFVSMFGPVFNECPIRMVYLEPNQNKNTRRVHLK